MKKKLIPLLSLGLLSLSSCNNAKAYSVKDYCLDLTWDTSRKFNILHMSDLHLNLAMDRDAYFASMKGIVDEAKGKYNNQLDLIVFTGDNFMFGDKSLAISLFKQFDSYGIPWTITWGNHDEQCYFSMEWLTSYLNELNDKIESNCVFKNLLDDNVFGDANFVLNLKDKNTKDVKEQIYIFDSNRYNYNIKEYFDYDYIHYDQVDWYQRIADEGLKTYGSYIPSLSFFHIPFPEFEASYKYAGGGESYTGVKIPGNKRNGFEFLKDPITGKVRNFHDSATALGDPKINTGLCRKMRHCNTRGVFVGHNHTSDYAVEVAPTAVFDERAEGDTTGTGTNPITLCFGIKGTDRVYYDKDYIGAEVISINEPKDSDSDGDFVVTEILIKGEYK